MQRRRGCAAWAALAVFAMAPAVRADPLANAKTQVGASDYLNARASLDEAYASGANSPEQLAEVWRLRGIVAGALNETKAATDAFQKCLALNPKADLPPGTSPKILRPFTAARDFFKTKEPLKLKSETATSPPTITVIIASDPLGMIAKVQVTAVVDGGAEKKLDGIGKDKIMLALPEGSRIDLRVAALDEKGNRLAELGSKEVPIVIIGTAKRPPDVKPPDGKTPGVAKKPAQPVAERPFIWKWWVWGGAAVLIGGTATYFGIDGLLAKSDLEDLNSESSNHDFSEAKSLERRARRDFLISNIGYGVAGALAIGAAILWLTDPKPTRESNVTVVPVEGGGAIVFGGEL